MKPSVVQYVDLEQLVELYEGGDITAAEFANEIVRRFNKGDLDGD